MITDDGILIVAETFGSRFTAFSVGADGALTDRRIWAQPHPAPEHGDMTSMLRTLAFAPDGCAWDAENHVWVARTAAH